MGNISASKLFNPYLNKEDWRVKENSNAPYSFGAMNKYVIAAVSKEYWEQEVYTDSIMQAHNLGTLHIHDMGGLTMYCCGYSLRTVLLKGVTGVPNIPRSKPAKHFDAVLNQLANLVTIFQNEIMGAVAFSSFDTLLAPFIRVDNLSYAEVKQCIQNYVYSVNSNSRAGAEPAFSNLTFDLFVPNDLRNENAIIGGELADFTYGQCQKEMDMLNRAFFEVMLEGDADGSPFAYPIPTYSIMKGFDWDNPNNDKLWEMAGKYGYPYFSNYLNSDMEPSDVRSMCCRLRLDLNELRRKNGGLFGSGDSTGSIGVVTINLPQIAYTSKSKVEFLVKLDYYMDLCKESLELKRKWLNKHIIGTGMVPAFDEYVGTLNNHFSTVGFVGMNEMCLNLLGVSINTEEGLEFSQEVLNRMRKRLVEYQQETGNLYNLEATPAESTCYRLAKIDKDRFGDIITQGTGNNVYYTNSTHLAVKDVQSITHLLSHQDNLQPLLTGGTVAHLFLGHCINGDMAKHIVKTACENYKIPYISLSPLICECKNHGFLKDVAEVCPYCGEKTKLKQKITGYIREVDNYNPGKLGEFRDRKQLGVD